MCRQAATVNQNKKLTENFETIQKHEVIKLRLLDHFSQMKLDEFERLDEAIKTAMTYMVDGIEENTDPLWWKERFIELRNFHEILGK